MELSGTIPFTIVYLQIDRCAMCLALAVNNWAHQIVSLDNVTATAHSRFAWHRICHDSQHFPVSMTEFCNPRYVVGPSYHASTCVLTPYIRAGSDNNDPWCNFNL